jgi:predicted DNA-binding protein (UPF0251 family)
MARIKVLEAIAGADFSWAPGDVVEVSDEEAASWADGHRAVLADGGQEHGAGMPAMVLKEPVVVSDDGQVLEVVSAVIEEIEPPAGVEDGPKWKQWSVTVRLPLLSTSDGGVPAGTQDSADLENQDPEEPAVLFNPDEHSNREVLAYLDTVTEQEALRVLDVEAAGQNRAGISKNRDQVLEAARARDAAAAGVGHAGAEEAADASRGGGRAETPETRDW